MAERIGMKRQWFQDPMRMRVSWPHYDIDKTRRAYALKLGAIACDKYQTVAIAAIIQGRLDKLMRIRALADPSRAFAPAAHLPTWLSEQGFSKAWNFECRD